jgi:DNA-binding MarR family transcriptional regulator
MASDDFISELGLPFLAHRFRRLSEILVEDIGEWLPEAGVRSPPRAGSTILLLRREGSLAITEIAARLRLTHPLIIGLVSELEELGLVKIERDPSDARRRLVALTKSGIDCADKIDRATKRIAEVYREVGAEIGVDLLVVAEKLEAACRKRPMAARLRRKTAKQPTNPFNSRAKVAAS